MTPRGYISYTQLSLWERSPEKYKELYMDGGTLPINRGMAFGKRVHEALEHNTTTGDPLLDLVISNMPKYKTFEHEIHANLKSGERKAGKIGIPLFGILDNYDKRTHDFADFKTGQKWWSKGKVDDDDQLTFYTLLIYAEFRVIPKNIALIQILTKRDPQTQQIDATGEYKVFKTTRTLSDILMMAGRIEKAWGEIGDMVMKELT